MATHKAIDKICYAVLACMLAVTLLFVNAGNLGIQTVSAAMGYEDRLFDTSTIHSVQIIMDDWEGFLSTCTNEEYATCTVIIDNEAYKNVAIRAKGNTSLTQVASYGNNRYSFKIEFDHYDNTKSYHGLDKLCLNNLIQDNTYMKDFLTYQMMDYFEVDAPLCSYCYITVNGQEWGLYLAVEGIEEAFLQRNYGSGYGELYKPDSQTMGGGRGNGQGFQQKDLEDLLENNALPNAFPKGEDASSPDNQSNNSPQPGAQITPPGINQAVSLFQEQGTANGFNGQNAGGAPTFGGGLGTERPNNPPNQSQEGTLPSGAQGPGNPFGQGGVMGAQDVLLVYTDDSYSSYSNIFDNAKTGPTSKDKDRLIASLKSLNANENLENVVNTGQVIRYFVVHNFVLNFDSYTGSMIHNYYLYEEDGRLSMLPWDYNLAFGGFQSMSSAESLVNYPIDTPISSGSIENRPMLAWIFENEAYTQLYHESFASFIASFFDSGYFTTLFDSTAALIAPYVERDPTKFCTYQEFLTGTGVLKEFCLLRAASVTGQLNGTIGATSQSQQDKTGFVSAEGLSIAAMGSMGNTMGGAPGNKGQSANPEAPNGNQGENSGPAAGQAPGTADGTPPTFNGNTGFPGGERPGNLQNGPGSNGSNTQTVNSQGAQWLLLGISAAVLLLGLFTARLFRRRRI